jgi:hypothetical protein
VTDGVTLPPPLAEIRRLHAIDSSIAAVGTRGAIECRFEGPSVYESRGKLQLQLLCGADDDPRGRINTEIDSIVTLV